MRALFDLKHKLSTAFRQFYDFDMRWSFYVIGGLLIAGIAATILLPHGWALCPFLFAAGVMSMVHEAAERNGQGVPPLYVYAGVVAILALWIILALLFSIFSGPVVLFGIIALGYQCARGYMQERQRTRLIDTRRAEGRCIYCGEFADPKLGVCTNCGQEPDPSNMRLKRVASIMSGKADTAHMRATLKPDTHASSAARKEQALIARRQARQHRPRK